MQGDPSVGLSAAALGCQGERECDAGDEEEEGEDKVHEMESVPVDMDHVFSDGLHERGFGEECRKGDDEAFASHDEEHVAASEGVERQEALGSSVFLHGVWMGFNELRRQIYAFLAKSSASSANYFVLRGHLFYIGLR